MTPFLYLEPIPIRVETPFKLRYASLPGVPQAGKCVYAFPSRVRCKARINSMYFIILPCYHLSRLNCIFAFFYLQNAIFCHRPAVFFRKAAVSGLFRSNRAFCLRNGAALQDYPPVAVTFSSAETPFPVLLPKPGRDSLRFFRLFAFLVHNFATNTGAASAAPVDGHAGF